MPRIEISINLNPGEDYAGNLERRLAEYEITKSELARELDMTPPELSRYFSENLERRVQPRIDTVVKIEQAVLEIRRRQRRAGKKAARKQS